jgi:hypothetical protein
MKLEEPNKDRMRHGQFNTTAHTQSRNAAHWENLRLIYIRKIPLEMARTSLGVSSSADAEAANILSRALVLAPISTCDLI